MENDSYNKNSFCYASDCEDFVLEEENESDEETINNNNFLIFTIMGNKEISNRENQSVLESGMDVIKDPNSGPGAKAAVVGLIAIGAITVITKAVIDVLGNDNK